MKMHMGMERDKRVSAPRHGHNPHLKPRQGRENIHQLLGLPAVTQSENRVSIGQNPQITMERVERVENHRRRAGAGERRGDFLADMTGLSDPAYNDLPPGLHAGQEGFHSPLERLVEPLAEALDLSHLQINDPPSFSQII